MQGKQPIVFQVEQASAFDSVEERGIRVQIKRILGETEIEILFDLIISEQELFSKAEKPRYGQRQSERKPPSARVDKNAEIMC